MFRLKHSCHSRLLAHFLLMFTEHEGIAVISTLGFVLGPFQAAAMIVFVLVTNRGMKTDDHIKSLPPPARDNAATRVV